MTEKKRKKGLSSALIWPFACLLVFGALIFAERSGVRYASEASAADAAAVPAQAQKRAAEKECLLVYDTAQESSADYEKNIAFVLTSMSVGYDAVDLAAGRKPSPDGYRTAIIAMESLESLGDGIFNYFDWVERGGRLLFAVTPQPSPTLSAICGKLGFVYSNLSYANQNDLRFETDLMPGAKGLTIKWGEDNRPGLQAQLTKDCLVHIISVGTDDVPMLWERPYGKGKVVVNNNDALNHKESRGLAAAAYSLLQDTFAYPVINASVFFIDDFPSPVPEGKNETIYKDYQRDIESFYTNVWYPDMVKLAEKYGIKYTGMLIETYGDDVTPPFAPNTATDRMRYFGRLLLANGYEMGAHGYNHMSLVLNSFDYKGELNYRKWNSVDDMANSLRELMRFGDSLFPGVSLKTYVPPSNVLSSEARSMLAERFPQINCISGVYINSEEQLAFEQEFDVSPDGIVNLPRLVSGCDIDDYFFWIALNELNFHYVNSHFMHPDDTLDPERGALEGWETLKGKFDGYLRWLYGSAKGLRSLTAQEAAQEVRGYCALSVRRTLTDDRLDIDLSGRTGDAYLMVRLNKGSPGAVEGGSLEPICGDLYLLRATSDSVSIAIKE